MRILFIDYIQVIFPWFRRSNEGSNIIGCILSRKLTSHNYQSTSPTRPALHIQHQRALCGLASGSNRNGKVIPASAACSANTSSLSDSPKRSGPGKTEFLLCSESLLLSDILTIRIWRKFPLQSNASLQV